MNHDNSAAAASLMAGFAFTYALVIFGIVLLTIVVNWRVAVKAGYSGALSLLMLVPLANFVVLLVFAFSEWPIEARLKAMTQPAPGPWQPPAAQPPAVF